jgi:hypothetical protein
VVHVRLKERRHPATAIVRETIATATTMEYAYNEKVETFREEEYPMLKGEDLYFQI